MPMADHGVTAEVTQVEGPELPVLDLKAFERTASFLTPEAISSYLRTVAERGERLLRCLRGPEARPYFGDETAEEVHTLAGSAGMLGFKRIAAVGRGFERALRSGAAEAPALALEMTAAIEVTLEAIRSRMPKVRDT
jgi:HPt (histidine-containing phosphotransfer) domain-containing protein